LPMFPWDDERVMDSTGALEMKDVPGKLLVVGGGIIGLEMATVYAALGSKVKGIHLKTKVVAAKATKKGIEVGYEGESVPETTVFDRVLVAVGRSPIGGKVGTEKAGVAVTERGFINVDTQLRTNVPHIFAIGDLVGQPMLAHKAVHEAHVAAEVAA